jgi:hypothetical protein
MSIAVTPSAMRAEVGFVVSAYLLSRLLIAATLAAVLLVRPDVGSEGVLVPLCRWDCHWYVELALDGYDSVAQRWGSGMAANWAFFPALPVLLKGVLAVVGGEAKAVSVVATQALFLVTLFLVHAYARAVAPTADPGFPRFATLLFALWPFSLYAAVPMSEALFLPLSLATLLAARQDRWIVAGFMAALLSASRIVGVLAVPAMMTLALGRYGLRALVTVRPGTERALIGMALGGLGLAAFLWHLEATTGDGLAFLHVQAAWERRLEWPWLMLVDELNPLVQPTGRLGLNLALTAMAAGLAALFVPLWRRRDLLPAEFVFAALVAAVALSGGRVMSLPRLLGVLFPLVMALALAVESARGRRAVLWLAGVGSVALLLVLFLEVRLGVWSELAM